MRDRARETYPFDKLPWQAGQAGQALRGFRVCVRTPPCVVPPGLDLREILPGTPVPGYRLSRPFGTDASGDLRFFSTPSISIHFREKVPQGLKGRRILNPFTARLRSCPNTN